MVRDFEHVHAAHCESGAFAALLRHDGLRLSEPMVFGIGSGLFFLYFPFVKLYGAPLVAYRDLPNAIIARCTQRLGVRIRRMRYRNQDEAMAALDTLVASGRPAGLQTGVFWLPYFPRDMRFQFNGHHVIAYRKDGADYLLSDTVFEKAVRCPAADLKRARFSQGPLAPKGLMYHVESVNPAPDLRRAAQAALKMTARRMLGIPLPFMGVRGIRTLARALERWPAKRGEAAARKWLAAVIRMQEEIGTGGAGFRFMYAAFLDEAAGLLEIEALREASNALSEAGDRWREFAVESARILRSEACDPAAWRRAADIVRDCAAREQHVFEIVRAAV